MSSTRMRASLLLWTRGLLLAPLLSGCNDPLSTEPEPLLQSSRLVVRVGGALQAVSDSGGAADTLFVAAVGSILYEHEVSPDGTRVAFIVLPSSRDPSELHLAALDGSSSVQVTGFDGFPRAPSWSPDSRDLVFATRPPAQLLTVGWDGTGLDTIVPPFAGNPHWSPAGDEIVYVGSDGVWTVRRDGSDAKQITDDHVFTSGTSGALVPAPRFSPDGEWIVIESEGDLYVVRADGTGRRQLTFSPQEDEWYPRWSPDGRRIAFVADGGAYWATRIMDVATGEVTGGIEANGAFSAIYASWSPDGNRIAFMLSLISGTRQEPGDRGRIGVAQSDLMSSWTTEPLPKIVGEGAFPEWWPGH